ncbi:MAG: hypothetical protein ABIV48_03875, partial [Pyrinomonadaceae bacterium]
MAILFGWSYLFPPQKPLDNANTANANTAAPSNTAQTTTPQPEATPSGVQAETAAGAQTPDSVPNRTITIKSPLYEVKLDSKGAVATSWVI